MGKEKEARRNTIGLIVPSLHLPWEEIQIGSIMDAAEKEDLNLIILPGGRLDSKEASESSRNVIYSLANDHNLDGLIIWSSGLSELVTEERLIGFIRSFDPLPVILAECKIEGYSHIFVESYKPLKALILHMIREHRYERLGYISGEVHHRMGNDRFRAYHDALNESGLSYRKEWIFEPLHSYDEELEIRRIISWYDKSGRDLDAVVVFNDTRARQFMRAMERIGISVPGDIALCSYDDTPNALFSHPYLTTVKSPFRDMATEAVGQLKKVINGEEVPVAKHFPGNVLIRESCGCSIGNKAVVNKKIERLTSFLSNKTHNLQLLNTMRAYLTASPSFWEEKDLFSSIFQRFLIRAAIPTCKIYLYKDPLTEDIIEKDRVLYEYFTFSKGVLNEPSDETIRIDEIRNNSDKVRNERFTFVVLPIYSKTTNFGLAVLEPGPRDGDMYETLMYILGSHFEENRLLYSINSQSENLKQTNEKLSTTIENLNMTRNMLVQSEKIAALSNLTGGIAHQINTPLGIAITAVSFLESCYSDFSESGEQEQKQTAMILDKTLSKSLPMIASNLNRVADLINTFKNIAAENVSGEKRNIVLHMFLKEQLASLRAVWNNRISSEVSCPETLNVESFPGILSQILSLLVENSVKHREDEEDKPFIALHITKENEKIHIDFSNDGPPIPEEVSGKIFEPFFSTKGGNQNPGLGLYIVHNLVTYKLHGSIELINKCAEGVCFRISLPL